MTNDMPDLYEALQAFAKVNQEFADEVDPGGFFWGSQQDPVTNYDSVTCCSNSSWASLCSEYLEASKCDDPCRQIDALNAILNASAEFDARRLPIREELEVFIEKYWGSMFALNDWEKDETIKILHEIVHINHFIDFANKVLVKFGGLR